MWYNYQYMKNYFNTGRDIFIARKNEDNTPDKGWYKEDENGGIEVYTLILVVKENEWNIKLSYTTENGNILNEKFEEPYIEENFIFKFKDEIINSYDPNGEPEDDCL